MDGLASTGCSPVLVDLPGHGRHAHDADPASCTLEAAMAGIEEAGAWPADLIGYSMGGRVGLHFAAAHSTKVRRLVLESASPGLPTEAERAERSAADEALACRIESDGVPAFVERWEALPLFESQLQLPVPVREVLRSGRLRNSEAGLAEALRGLGTGALPSLWERLPAIEAPTLVLAGELDPKFAAIAERMAAALPEAHLAIVPGAGHAVHLERPDAWVEAVGTFLSAD